MNEQTHCRCRIVQHLHNKIEICANSQTYSSVLHIRIINIYMQHISLTNALPRSRTDQASGPQDAANTAAVTNGLDVMALQCMS